MLTWLSHKARFLLMVILGYLWYAVALLTNTQSFTQYFTGRFLYQGREVSYSSVLAQSISRRRDALYKGHGFDIERWVELVGERKSLQREIGRIAEDYEERVAHDFGDEAADELDGGGGRKSTTTPEDMVKDRRGGRRRILGGRWPPRRIEKSEPT